MRLPRVDEGAARRAIARLRESTSGAPSMADALAEALAAGEIDEDVIARHSTWCHTGGRWSAGREPARAAAQARYGFIPERLLASDGRRTPDHDARIRRIAARIEAGRPG